MSRPIPFARGTVSVNVYCYDSLSPSERCDAVIADAVAVEAAGFDGITVSEHHGNTPGYFPAPVTVASWLLEGTIEAFVAPMPVVLPLRPTAGLVEEMAWLCARHPGRVGLGVAPGYSHADFELSGIDYDERVTRFATELPRLTALLGGRAAALGDPLVVDPAIALLADSPVPVVSAAGSPPAARRAADAGCGIVLGSHSTAEEAARIITAYRTAGGTGDAILGRRVWLGDETPVALQDQFALYQRLGRGDAPWSASTQQQQVLAGPAARVTEELVTLLEVTGATALSLRVHVPGASPQVVRAQFERIGVGVLPNLRVLSA